MKKIVQKTKLEEELDLFLPLMYYGWVPLDKLLLDDV